MVVILNFAIYGKELGSGKQASGTGCLGISGFAYSGEKREAGLAAAIRKNRRWKRLVFARDAKMTLT